MEILNVASTMRRFLEAQRLSVINDESLVGDIQVLQTDDAHSLINTFVCVGSVSPDADVLSEEIRAADLEPNRTVVLMPDTADSEALHSEALSDCVSVVVPISRHLDSYLRPDRVCDSLIASPRTADESETNALLDESDFISQTALIQPDEDQVDAMKYLFRSWASGTSPRFAVVLAPAGYGKSKLAHILALRLARAYKDGSDRSPKPPLPFLISFAQYRRTTSFAGLVLQALESHGTTLLTVDAFQFLVDLGRVLFILDGFDEMVENAPEVARDNIRDFVQHAGDASRVMLTSRTTFFRTHSDVEAEFENHRLTDADIDVLELQGFNPSQIGAYLGKNLPQGRSRIVSRARELARESGYAEVLRTPLFLKEFSTSVADPGWSLTQLRGADFYTHFVNHAFDREQRRQGHEFSRLEQERFLEGVAFEMLRSGIPGIEREDLEIFALEAIEDVGRAEEWEALCSHHFLTDLPGTRAVSMRHQLWRDYFQGRALAERLVGRDKAVASQLLAARELPEGVMTAIHSQLSWDAYLSLADRREGMPLPLVKNLMKGLLNSEYVQERFDQLVQAVGGLSGVDLRDLVFRELDFGRWPMTGTDLEGAAFHACLFGESSLKDATIRNTTFSECALGASISQSRFASAAVDGTVYYGSSELSSLLNSIGIEAPTGEVNPEDTVAEILRERLAKFVKGTGEIRIIDRSISWTAFLGGSDPTQRDFIRVRVYRALRAEGIISERRTARGNSTLQFGDLEGLQTEVLSFTAGGSPGQNIRRALDRLH